jgi:DNA-directed RNA polymerase subunit omega
MEIPGMYDEFREEEIVRKVGGRFKLSTLIQKRLVALNKGATPLVHMDTQDKMKVVIQEILQDKIYLDSESKVRVVGAEPGAGGPPEFDLASL